MEITREQDEAMSRSIDAHGQHLKESIESGCCARCGYTTIRTEVNYRHLRFSCTRKDCTWQAIYPIRTLGNSERAQRDEELDLIAISEREVIKKAKALTEVWKSLHGEKKIGSSYDALEDLLAEVTLLEAREGMKATDHLDEVSA